MSEVLGFVSSVIDMIKTIIGQLQTGFSFVAQIVNVFPVYFIAPLIAILAILVVYAIIGRGA